MSLPEPSTDLELLSAAARRAGEIAMGFFGSANQVWTKSGDSPVSEADFAVDTYLRETLCAARPDYGWLSEETEDTPERLSGDTLFIVDPIDGTRGFLAGSVQWCISMAVVHRGRPVAGVLYSPAAGRLYEGASGRPARLNGGELPRLGPGSIERVTGSRKLNDLIERKCRAGLTVHPFVPSLAYRLAMVASGEIDAAIARPGAHDWDLAAAELVLEGVGGVLTGLDGQLRQYNRPNPVSGSLIACARPRHAGLLKLAKSSGFLH